MSSKSAGSIRLFVSKTLLTMAFASAATAANAQVSGPNAKAPAPKLSGAPSVSGQVADAAKMSATFSRLPLAFEANGGQLDPRVKFISRGSGYNLFLTGNEAVLSLAADKSGKGGDVVRLKIAGANSKTPVSGLDVLPGKTNYFIGKDPAKWRTNISNYSKVRYANVYRGIDLVYYGNQQQLEHDFVVAPGADPKKIALEVTGAQKLHVDASGDLVLEAKNGELRFKKPLIYQEKNGARIEIAGGYQIEKQSRVSFQVGDYDHSRELTIDPVLNYSTYLSASSSVSASAIAVDSSGNAYITGTIAATGGTPFVPTAFDSKNADGCFFTSSVSNCATPVGGNEVFVAKLNATGTALTFLSIIGGSGADTGNAVAIDTANPPAVYVTGQTSSNDFPTTAGAFNTTPGSIAPDAYAVKLQSDGAALLYSTYLNGGAAATDFADNGTGIAVGPNGNIYVTGSTASTTFFPATFASGEQIANAGGVDAFLLKLNPAGTGASDLLYGTYWGGTGNDAANAIALLRTDKAYIAGFTQSADYVTTASAVQATIGGAQDGFIASVNTNSATVTSATCEHSSLGDANTTIYIVTQTAHGLAPGDKFHLVGIANSTGSTVITFNAVATTHTAAAGTAGTLIKYAGDGNCKGSTTGDTGATTAASAMYGALNYSTFLGGDVSDEIKAIALDAGGNAYVTGSTTSTTTFPAKGAGTLQAAGLGGGTDAFVAKLNATGAGITYSGYLGGAGDEVGTAIAVNKNCASTSCEAYIAGSTTSGSGFFNTNALQGALNGARNGFVARISGNTSTTLAKVYSTYFGGSGTDTIAGIAATYSGTSASTNNLYLVGNTNTGIGAASSFGAAASVVSSTFQTAPIPASTGSAFVAKLSASSAAMPSLGISGNKNLDPIGQSAAFTSAVTYTWTVTNTNLARAVTVDIPMPQTAGTDSLSISGTPVISGTGIGSVDSITITSGGTGYTSAPTVSFSGGGGTGAAATATTGGGPVTAVTVGNQGTGYTTVPSVTFSGGGGSGAAATATVSAGKVTAITVTSGGTGYTSAPTVSITGGSGSNAAATATAITKMVTGVNLTFGGSGYTSPPTVSFSGGGGSGAAATTTTASSACIKKVGTATAPGGLTCNLGDLNTGGSTSIVVSAAPNSAASCANSGACTPISQVGKVSSAETSSLVTSSTLTSNVAPVTDLVITGTVASNPGASGSGVFVQGTDTDLTYNITVTNNSGATIAGNSAGLDVLIESDYPANYSVSSVTLNGNPIVLAALAQGTEGCFDDSANHKVQCNVLSIAAAGTATMSIAGTFSAAASNPALANLITTSKFPPADTSEIFTSTGSNTNVAINVNYQGPLADLDVTVGGGLTDSPDPVRGGQTLTYTVSYTNIGPTDASNVTITQSFTPSVVQTAKFSATTMPGFCTQAIAGANVVCAIPDATVSGAAKGVQQSFTISGAAPLDANVATDPTFGSSVAISTTGGTSDPVAGNNTSSTTTVIRREGKLSVDTLSAPATSPNGPATFQFTFNVANAGLDNATNTHVTFSLPQNVSAISISPGSCTGAATTTPDCNIGTVNAAGTVPVTVTVTPAVLGAGVASANFNISITNVASAEVVDLTPGVGKTAGPVTTAVQRQTTLSIAMVQNTPAAAGPITTDGSVAAGQVTYRATINNAGANIGTNVKIGFLLPTNFILKTAPVNAGGTCANNGTPAPPAGFVRLECTIASIPAGPTNVDLVIAAPAALVPSNANSATMDVMAELDLSKSTEVVDSQGAVTLTSAPTITTTVQRLGDLIIQSFSATTPVSSDGNITNQIVVSNGGTVDATSVQVVFTFDNQLRFQSANVVNANTNTTGALSCPAPAPAATTVTCTLPDLKPNKPYTFNIITKAESGIVQTRNPTGKTTNVQVDASISGAVVEQNAADNTTPFAGVSTPVTIVQRQADLLVISNGLTPATQTTNSGGQTTYNLTVKNNGPDTDSNGHVTFSFVSTTAPTVGQPVLFTASDLTGAAGLGTCTANSPAPGQVNCILAPPFTSGQTRTGTIKITPPALTGGQTSASFDTSAIVQSTTAFDDLAGAPGTNNTSSTVPSTVQTQSDVKVTSVVASSPNLASPIAPGANIADSAALQYTVTFTNVGDPAGTGANPVVLSHTLPDEIIGSHYGYTVNTAAWSSSLGTPGSCLINGGNVAAGPPVVVTCRSTSGTIPSGDVITIVEDGFANIAPTQNPPSFAFTDSVTIPVNAGYIDPTPSNNSGNAQAFQVVRTADLGVVQSGGIVVTPILPGNVLDTPGANFEVTKHIAVQYDVTVQNLSGSSSVSNVVVDSVLPSSPNTTALTFSSGTNCSVFAAGPPQTVRCTVPAPLGPAGTATVSFILTPNATLPTSTTVQLSFNPSVSAAGNTDTNPSNNSNIPAAITIDRIADLGITIAAPALSFPTVLPGTGGAAVVFPVDSASSANYSYTINVSNGAGPSNANNVVVSDVLASNPVFGLAFISGTWPSVAGTPGTPSGTCSAVGQTVTCNIGTIDAGTTVPITLTVKPTLSTTTAQQAVANNVSVASGTVADQNGSNNSGTVSVLLRGKSDLQVAIVPVPLARPSAHANISANANPAHALVGDQVRYDVTITNNGPYPAGSVITLTDTIDPKVSLLSITANQFTCAGSPVISCTLNSGSLGVGANTTAAFVTDVPASAIGVGLSTAVLNNQALVTQYSNGSNLSQDATDLDFALAAASNNNASNNISADIASDLAVTQSAPAQVLTAALLLPAAPDPAVFTVSVRANQDVTTLNTTPANVVDGRSTATNVVLTNVININPNNSVTSITVPAGCVASAVTVLNATTDKATVTCNLNSIADGTISQVAFSMRPTKPGTITNTPSVTSSNGIEVDPSTSNNSLSVAAITASTIAVNNTPPGPQTVNPVDPVTGVANLNVSVFFPNVAVGGSSFVTVTSTPVSGSPLPATLVPPAKYFNLSSQAITDKFPITVCVNYTGTTFINPERVRLYFSSGASSGVDVTTSLDQVAHIVCGAVPQNQQLPTSLTGAAAFSVSEPRNTAPHTTTGKLAPSAALSQQSSGKGVTGTSVTLTSNIEDSDINQGCYTPIGSNAVNSTSAFCSDVLTFTWTGQFTDGTVKTFTCAAPYTSACQTLDVSVTTTAQTLHLTVTDQTGDVTTGVLGPIDVPLSQTGSSGGGGSNSITVNKGQTATFSNVLTVTYTGSTPLTLTLTGTPSLTSNQITCAATPATLAGPVQNQAVTVLCSTQGQVFAMSAPPRNTGRGDAPILASMVGLSSLPLVGMLLLPGKSRRKRLLKIWAIFGLLLLMVAFQASCGGGGGSFGGAPVLQNAGTPAGTYAVTVSSATGVTAKYGTTANGTAATSLTLVVQ